MLSLFSTSFTCLSKDAGALLLTRAMSALKISTIGIASPGMCDRSPGGNFCAGCAAGAAGCGGADGCALGVAFLGGPPGGGPALGGPCGGGAVACGGCAAMEPIGG